MAKFAATFVAVLLVLFVAELTPPGQRWFVQPWTAGVAKASTAAIRSFDSGVTLLRYEPQSD